jgi:hypothetical protein
MKLNTNVYLRQQTNEAKQSYSQDAEHKPAHSSVPPSKWNKSYFENLEYQSILKYHTGCKILSYPVKCAVCDQLMDVYGDHAIASCEHGSSEFNRIGKHDAIVRCISTQLSACGIWYRTELGFNEQRPGDIFIPDWTFGNDLWIDVSVVSTLCP